MLKQMHPGHIPDLVRNTSHLYGPSSRESYHTTRNGSVELGLWWTTTPEPAVLPTCSVAWAGAPYSINGTPQGQHALPDKEQLDRHFPGSTIAKWQNHWGHNQRYSQIRARTVIYQNSIVTASIVLWNNLSQAEVDHTSLECFNSLLAYNQSNYIWDTCLSSFNATLHRRKLNA